MEVLSTGEKIKRARVYKGLTLKDICGDKISVSKMSCIENGKVLPEDWVLNIVADKLGIQLNYLRQNIREQLMLNIGNIRENKDVEDLYKELIYNIDMAVENSEYYIAFDFINILFEQYLNNNEMQKIKDLHFLYYDIFQKAFNNINNMLFSINIGRFLLQLEEYSQALVYFIMVEETAAKEEVEIVATAVYYQIICYKRIHNTEGTYRKAMALLDLMPKIEKHRDLSEFYRVIAYVNIGKDREKFLFFKEMAAKHYDSNCHKANALLSFARGFFENSEIEDGIRYLSEAQELFPKEDDYKYVDFILRSTKILMENNNICIATEVIEDVLNKAINLNELKFIEKVYYFKAMICKNDNNCLSGEMYMNLSLDALSKVGSKKEIYNRYLEMGKMYFDMKNDRESIKYFNLALNLSKEL